jgi:cytochrome c
MTKLLTALLTTTIAAFAVPAAMAKDQLGRKSVYLDEMIQGCMVMPMAAKPLPWDFKELAGLTAYLLSVQKTFKPSH